MKWPHPGAGEDETAWCLVKRHERYELGPLLKQDWRPKLGPSWS